MNQAPNRTPHRLRKWALLLLPLLASQARAETVVLVNNNFDSAPYSAVAQSSYTSTAVGIPDTEDIVIDDGFPYPGAPSALGENGVQVVNWSYHSAPNAMLVRPGSSFRCNFNPRGGTNYVWDFWMLCNKGTTADRGLRLHLLGEGADVNQQDVVVFRSKLGTTQSLSGVDGVDTWESYNGIPGTTGAASWMTISNTSAGTPFYCTNNVWNHYRLVVNTVNFTVSYYVNDMVTPMAAMPIARPQRFPITSIQFETSSDENSGDDEYILVDDVSLTADGSFVDLANGAYSDGFEGYTASTSANVGSASNIPGGAWLTAATTGGGANAAFAPQKVQVVDSSVTAPHSGSKCLMVQGGQVGGATLSWAQATNEDVKITWWAKVPATPNNNSVASVYLRMSLYGWEAGGDSASDSILLGFGHRNAAPYGGAQSIFTFSRWASTWYGAGGAWEDTLQSYTPDTWEEYQLTTHVSQNSYTIIKNPGTTPVTLVRDGQFITSWDSTKKMHTIGFSSSNGTGHPPVYLDDITIEPYTNPEAPLPAPYTPTFVGNRFTNYTVLDVPGRTIGGVCVDPRDSNTIVFTVDSPVKGAIMIARKVASGNWQVDPAPIVSGQNMAYPNSCRIGPDGTLWWVHDNRGGNTFQALRRLKAPWASNTWEEVISDFGGAPVNAQDQPCDLVFVPSSFSGTKPALAVLDRGVNGNNPNAIWLVDPATTSVQQSLYANALVAPDTTTFGAGLTGNANAIDALPATGELATIWEGDGVNDNGVISIFDGSGAVRYIYTTGANLTLGSALAVDPKTQRIWVADEKSLATPSAFALPQIVSFDSTNGAFAQELTFPNNNPSDARPDLRINFHDPGLTFSPDGKFLVVVDQTLASNGGRLVIFHNEAFTVPAITISHVSRAGTATSLSWTSAGAVNYVVQRSPTVNGTYADISGPLTGTSFTDTSSPSGSAFYRVQAVRQN